MRILVLALLAVTIVSATAQKPSQPPPAGSNWQHVQALPVGASIHVKARTGQTGCTIKSVDADTLTCTHGKDVVFQRSDIVSIKVSRRGRSTLAGMAIGAGGGAIVGVSLGRNGSFVGRGAAAAIVAIPSALIGAIIGASTDFAHSTVYKAP